MRCLPRALSSPLKLRVLPSLESVVLELVVVDEDELPLGAPVDDASRVRERVNAASRSYITRQN